MELFTNQVLAGIATGAIYACMALAVVMIYQAIDHLNFAQGEMAMFSTFISWQLMQWGIPYWFAFVLTLAFSFIINTVILEARWLTNGARGISVQRPEIFGLSFDGDAAFTYLCLGFAILTLFATLNIRRSRVGRAFVAIRDNDTAARVMGINLHAYKLFAFVTSAFITGLAGALYGIYLSFVSVEGFPFLLSIEALAILIVGGLGSALGAVLGTILIVLLPEATRLVFSLFSAQMDAMFTTGAQELKSMLYGFVIILFLRFQPRGLVGAWHDIRRMWVNWPLRY